ncbi:MAG: tRNA (adenosine(37)-N6)-dimethylallyltransferase MiaA [Stagnimonas sp.]|nr:tRNA (adenosine(37)-N6)-dimethylallyltransferase MiaA [Stagnimonas sp.]
MSLSPRENAIPALFLMGPTASGKTGLALALHAEAEAGRLPWAGADLVSVDSAQVFRQMDIGTAKPDAATLARVPHALIDILDPAESYSAARFRVDALALVAASRARGRLPILVGGTSLYFRALQYGLSELPAADPAVRARLEAEAAELGWPALHERLAALDPEAGAKIKPMDQQRIQRALEILELSGRSRSEHWAAPRSEGLPGPLVKLALMPPEREVLHAAIERRFRQMMAAGFLDEVRALRARGDLDPALPAIRAVGYRQLWEHLDGRGSLSEAVERGVVATRQYAKRQITWLRSEADTEWIDPRAGGAALARVVERLRGAA